MTPLTPLTRGALLRPAVLAVLVAACGLPAAAAADPAPARIVSLAPSLTEILFRLDLGDRVRGVTDFCDTPPAARAVAKVGGFANPSAERIVALEPDLVVATPNIGNREAVETVRRLGIPVLVVDARNLDQLFESIAAIGAATGREAAATTLVGTLRADIDRLVGRVAGRPRPRVLMPFSRDPYIVAGTASYPGELIRLAGGRPPDFEPDTSYPRIGLETILVWAPEVILEPDGGGRFAADPAAAWQRWPTLPAVAGTRIHSVPADLMSRPGPRVAEAVRALIAILHPGAVATDGDDDGTDR